jgi:hypothetical protein
LSAAGRKLKRARRKQQARIVRDAARAQGCTCNPTVAFDPPWHPLASHDVGEHVSVHHDDWCPLLRVMEERGPDLLARTQILLSKPDDEGTP